MNWRVLASFLVAFVASACLAGDASGQAQAPASPQSSGRLTFVPVVEWAAASGEDPHAAASLMKVHAAGIRSIVVHHSETPPGALFAERARLRSIRRYHKQERGWGDVACHDFIGTGGVQSGF